MPAPTIMTKAKAQEYLTNESGLNNAQIESLLHGKESFDKNFLKKIAALSPSEGSQKVLLQPLKNKLNRKKYLPSHSKRRNRMSPMEAREAISTFLREVS